MTPGISTALMDCCCCVNRGDSHPR
jgi:hypothetical protein